MKKKKGNLKKQSIKSKNEEIEKIKKATEEYTRMSEKNYFLLLQINDSVFPIGSFIHSFGLETYIQKNLVKDRQTAYDYIKSNLLGTFLYTEVYSLILAYEKAGLKDIDGIKKIDEYVRASKAALESREASEKIGSRFIRAVEPLQIDYQNESYKKYVKMIDENSLITNHAVIYGVFCSSAGIELDKAIKNYLYSNTSTMVTNCVKTVPLSQTDGQKILTELYDVFDEVIENSKKLEPSDLCRSMPGFEIRSMQHEYLYSRLYMS